MKLKLAAMLPICAWAWLMHCVDLEFQIMPSLHENGVFTFTFPFLTGSLLVDAACLMFIGGFLAKLFLWSLRRHPVYPLKDPRMAEAVDIYVPPAGVLAITPEHANEH